MLPFFLLLVVIRQIDGQFISGPDAFKGILGGRCNPSPPVCNVDNAECLDTICSCIAGFIPSNGRCEPVNEGCSGNQRPYMDPNTPKPLQCSQVPDNCPTGYKCTRSSINNRMICCGIPDGYCPSGSTPYLNPSTQTMTMCSSLDPTCPMGYVCLNVNQKYFCCSVTRQVLLCPPPTVSLRQTTGEIYRCSADYRYCPLGYACVNYNGIYLCCSRTVAQTYFCPSGKLPYSDPSLGTFRYCSFTESRCPAGDAYLCCSTTTGLSVSQYCSPGSTPFIDGMTGTVRFCAAGISCPPGFTCGPASGVCCAITTGMQGSVCPDRRLPYVDATGRIQTCTRNSLSCPKGYICSYFNGAYVCCAVSQSLTCPGGLAPLYNSLTSLLYVCGGIVNSVNCPNGFQCVPVSGLSICCPAFTQEDQISSGLNGQTAATMANLCPGSFIPFVDVGVSSIRSCNTASPSDCPRGYRCILSSGQLLCCPDTSLNSYCPTGMSPFVDTGGLIQSCTPQTGYFCPTEYSCVYSNWALDWICCTIFVGTVGDQDINSIGKTNGTVVVSDATLNLCRNDRNPLIDPDGKIVICNGGLVASCPFDFLCNMATTTIGVCCPWTISQLIGVCPNASLPLIDLTTQSPLDCSSSRRCPNGTKCVSNSTFNRSFCCNVTTPVAHSGVQSDIQMNQTGNRTIRCKQESDCAVEFSTCDVTKEVCVCITGYVSFGGFCIQRALINTLFLNLLKQIGQKNPSWLQGLILQNNANNSTTVSTSNSTSNELWPNDLELALLLSLSDLYSILPFVNGTLKTV